MPATSAVTCIVIFETGACLILELIVLLDWIVSRGSTVYTGPALGLQATAATHSGVTGNRCHTQTFPHGGWDPSGPHAYSTDDLPQSHLLGSILCIPME